MKKVNLEIGFWHPFGDHGGESAESILKRKSGEIQRNKWTLWSFQYRTKETRDVWCKEIREKKPRKVLVFCSDGNGTKDAKSKKEDCSYYIPAGENTLMNIPSKIKVPHPMGKNLKGSAFIVSKIYFPVDFTKISVDWFYSGKKKWQIDRSSTRGEHLIRIGHGKPMGKYRAVLELKYPYLAEVGIRRGEK